ncbi:MAG: DUF115 domain-containing protein [Deltaproteobacteria bacterium]|nr:DUF115 domain-containing protein [Deltaproteobacteria bacterium]
MDIFEKNMGVLEKKDAELARMLREPGLTPVTLERTRSGDYTFQHGGRYFHSRYDPLKEAGVQADEILSRNPDWVVLFGLGCGYLLNRLISRGMEKVIIHEPRAGILKGVLSGVDLSAALDMPDVHITLDSGSAAGLVRTVVDGMDDVLAYQTPAYGMTFPEELADLTRKTKNAHMTNKAGIATEVTSCLKWVENYFANLKSFFRYPSVDVLRGRFKGAPLVIAGAGPSLDRNAHVLKEFRDRVLVISAITAFKPLLRHGVVPDLVIAAEKKDLPEFFTHGPDDRRTRFLLAEVANNNMFERETGGKLVYFNPYSRLSVEQARFWGSDYFPANGGSVTTVALEIGRMFGCDPIIFIGQDLAYGEGKTHADDSFYHNTKVSIDAGKKVVVEGEAGNRANDVKELLWLKGLDGKPVPSRYDWVTFHQWFEKEMAGINLSGSGLKVINATEGGAYIEGMEHISLKEALDRHACRPLDTDGIIAKAESERPPVDSAGLIASFEKTLESLTEIHRLSQSIVKTARGIRKRLKGGLGPEIASRVEKIKRLEEGLFEEAGNSAFIWELLASYTYTLREYLRKEEEGTTEEQFGKNLKALIDSYGRFEEMSGRFIPVLNEAIATVKAAGTAAAVLSA